MSAVPFQLDEVYLGFAACHGLIRNEGDHLCLEFQVEDSIVGALKTEVKQARIAVGDIASISVQRGWFGWSNSLVIQAESMEALEEVPGMKHGRLELPIKRRDRDFADQFVAIVQKKLGRLG